MIIGFDGRKLSGNLSGLGFYIQQLLVGVSNTNKCIVYCYEKPKNLDNRNIVYRVCRLRNRIYFEQLYLPLMLTRDRVDIFHQTNNFGVPLIKKTKYILTIHDIIPYKISNYFGNNAISIIRKWIYRIELSINIKIADLIIFVSKSTRKDVVTLFHKVGTSAVIPNGISLVDGVVDSLENNFVISNIGGIEKRKNIEMFIDVINQIYQVDNSIRAYITGDIRKEYHYLINRVTHYGLGKIIKFTGYLPRRKLINLIKQSKIICTTSSEEGFALPIVEAISLGIPVVASDIPCHKEFKSKLLFLYKNNSIFDLQNKIVSVKAKRFNIIDRKQESLKILHKYSWQNVTTKMLVEYKNLK